MLAAMGKPDFHKVVPAGDDRLRWVCRSCGHIAYENPKVIAGSVVEADGRILLCKRAIEPRKGYWTLPAGFLELGESVEEGAVREAWEEAHARIAIDRVLAIYTIRHISQVQVMFRATLTHPEIVPGPESEALELLSWSEIPWGSLAFPSVKWALRHWHDVRFRQDFAPFGNPPDADEVDPVT